MLEAMLKYHFLQHALMAGVLTSIVCGVIGVIVIEKKLVMLSGGIAHTSLGGVGLGYLLGFEPILGAFLFSIAASLAIGAIGRRKGGQSDVAIGLFWSSGMALGILFVSLMNSYPPDLTSYLFGNILSVTQTDLKLMAGLTVIVLLVIFSLFDTWKAYLFDSEFAQVMGIWTSFLDNVLLVLIAMTVVVMIRAVGIILVLALLTAPAATAGLLVKSFRARMALAALFGMIFCFAGLWLSYSLNLSSGASIAILSSVCYFAVYAGGRLHARRKYLAG
jgi:zinc transport system permease protein